MSSQLQSSGAQPQKPVKFTDIHTGRFFQGLYTNRSPLRMGTIGWAYEKYLGGMNDSLIAGANSEISNKLTLVRRPGCPKFSPDDGAHSSASFTDVQRFFEFRMFGPTTEDINVMVDTQAELYEDVVAKNPVFLKTTTAQTYMESIGNTLFFSDGQDRFKWVNTVTTRPITTSGAQIFTSNLYTPYESFILDPNGNLQQYVGAIVPVTKLALQVGGSPNAQLPNILTVTLDPTNSAAFGSQTLTTLGLSAGQVLFFYNLSVDSALNGTTVVVATVDVTNNKFTAYVSTSSITGGSQTGDVIFMDSGIPVNPYCQTGTPSWATTALSPATGWNTDSKGCYPANVLTFDGQVLWICRDNATSPLMSAQGAKQPGVFRWGIAAPVAALAQPQQSGGTGQWHANTYYSPDSIYIDARGNLLQVTTAGQTGTSAPNSGGGAAVGNVITDGTVRWVVIQLAPLAYSTSKVYAPGQYAVANGCIFQLQTTSSQGSSSSVNIGPVPRIVKQPSGADLVANMTASDSVRIYEYDTSEMGNPVNPGLWTYDGTHYSLGGSPTSPGTYKQSSNQTSVLFNPGQNYGNYGRTMYATDSGLTGELAQGSIIDSHDWGSDGQRWSMVALFSLYFPVAGTYSALVQHDDGYLLGATAHGSSPAGTISGNGPQVVTGGYTSGKTACNAYPILFGTNTNGYGQDTACTINVTAPGQYDFEIDYFQWESAQALVLQIQGASPAPDSGTVAGNVFGSHTVTIAVDPGVNSNASTGYAYLSGAWSTGGSNAYRGQAFDIQGFMNAGNNGTFVCLASDAGWLLLQNLNLTVNPTQNETSVSGVTGYLMTMKSMATAPQWPGWKVNPPGWQEVQESGTYNTSVGAYAPTGDYLWWENHGAKSDFVWQANTQFTLPNTAILDPNNNLEYPYRTGISGSVAPSPTAWSTKQWGTTNDTGTSTLVWVNEGPGTVTQAGNFSSSFGYKYAVALVNSLDSTYSNISPLSPATTTFLNANYVKLPAGYGLPQASLIDPQADMVAIFRTTDGGALPLLIPPTSGNTNNTGQNTFGAFPNATLPLSEYLANGYEDSNEDGNLDTTATAPFSQNTPPAAGARNLVQHLGRIFYSIGNVVYWTSGPDDPVGNGFNGSDPSSTYSEVASLVTRLVPFGDDLFVFTVSDVWFIPAQNSGAGGMIIGEAQPVLGGKGYGLSSYNALDLNGSLVGMFTTDNTFIVMDIQSGVTIASHPIANLVDLSNGEVGTSWTPSEVYVTWHKNGEDIAWYLCDGVNGWYRVCQTPSPETGMSWSPFAEIAGGAGCVQSIETAPGVHNLLIGNPTSGPVLMRGLVSESDYTDGGTATQNNGTAYYAYSDIGSILLVHSGAVAELNHIAFQSTKVGIPARCFILLDEAEPYWTGPFDEIKEYVSEPINLPESSTILMQRFYVSDNPDETALCQHLQVRVDWAKDTVQNELHSYTIYGGFLAEI